MIGSVSGMMVDVVDVVDVVVRKVELKWRKLSKLLSGQNSCSVLDLWPAAFGTLA